MLSIAVAASLYGQRIDYVRSELLKEKIPASYADSLFKDKRLKTYPELIENQKNNTSNKYSANILAAESINRGSKFMEEHEEVLEATENEYGVPKEEIVAVLRVESNLGEYLGNLTVLNVFYTRMTSAAENKWKWDATNLVALGKYCYANSIDCYSIKGSSAGAFGLAQFLPYSAMEWGVDGNSDGKINLFDASDSIPSAANFLKQHGWDTNSETALAKYYGSGRAYPTAVLGYAEALRKNNSILGDNNRNSDNETKGVKTAAAFMVKMVYCLFSNTPFCGK